MNKEQLLTIIQGGHTTDGDLADALLAELANGQDPVAWNQAGNPLYLHPAPSVPEGYQLVPIEPTDATQRAGGHVNSEWLNDSAPIGENRYGFPMPGVWKAMLSAARSE